MDAQLDIWIGFVPVFVAPFATRLLASRRIQPVPTQRW